MSQPDLQKISRVLIAFAEAQAETEARAQAQAASRRVSTGAEDDDE